MFNKVIIGNGGILRFIFDYYKDQKRCDKAVDNYSHALKTAPDCFKPQAVGTHPSAIQFVSEDGKTQETFDKVVDTCPFVFTFVPDQYVTQEIYDKLVSKESFMLTLNLFLVGLLQVRLLKNVIMLYFLMMI